MAMSHEINEQSAEEWYKQTVDLYSKDRDPKHAKINRKEIPLIKVSTNRYGREIYRVTFKYYANARFKSRNKKQTLYQKKYKILGLREHETYQDAEKHMYSDIYNYLHKGAASPAQRKRKNQDKERAKRANARTMRGDEQAFRRLRRCELELLKETWKQSKESRENQRGKLRPSNCNRKRKSPPEKSELCPSKKQKLNKVERIIQTKKETVKQKITEFVELESILENAYGSLEMMAFVKDGKANEIFLPLSTDDDVENMAAMQLAPMSCTQVNHLLYQIGTVKAFCSTHLDNLTAHLEELKKIDNAQDPRKVGPLLPGWNNSIQKLEINWEKYGAKFVAKKKCASRTTVYDWVNHWMKNKTFNIPNYVPNTTSSWLVV